MNVIGLLCKMAEEDMGNKSRGVLREFEKGLRGHWEHIDVRCDKTFKGIVR